MDPHPDLTSSVLTGLGWYYLVLFVINLLWTLRSFRVDGEYGKNVPILAGVPVAALWAALTAVLLLVSLPLISPAGRDRNRL